MVSRKEKKPNMHGNRKFQISNFAPTHANQTKFEPRTLCGKRQHFFWPADNTKWRRHSVMWITKHSYLYRDEMYFWTRKVRFSFLKWINLNFLLNNYNYCLSFSIFGFTGQSLVFCCRWSTLTHGSYFKAEFPKWGLKGFGNSWNQLDGPSLWSH